MIKNFFGRFMNILVRGGWTTRLAKIVVILIIMGSYIAVGGYNYIDLKKRMNELVYSRRTALVDTTAEIVRSNLQRLSDLAISFATRMALVQSMKEGKWDDVASFIKTTEENFSDIDYIFITDSSGILKNSWPAMPEIMGDDFAYRDWYQGVVATGGTYVSEVYQRANKPQINIIVVATPVYDEDKNVVGVLALQIPLSRIAGWIGNINVGEGVFTYLTDQKGKLIAHPGFSSGENVIDFSMVPIVQKALKGEAGAEIAYSQIEKEEYLSVYKQVPIYHWGVVVQQPTKYAFAAYKEGLRQMIIFNGFGAIILLLLSFFIFRLFSILNSYHQKEKIYLDSIGDGVIGIDRGWRITTWNAAAEVLTGYSKAEAMGKPFREYAKFVGESDRKENINFIEEAMLYGEARKMKDRTILIRKDGRDVYVGDSAAPIMDKRKNISGAIIVFRDVSHEREIEKAREEFSSLASHQLKAPVAVIKGTSEMLLESKGVKGEDRQMVKDIFEAGSRMNDLVNALLNVSRLELGTIAIEPEAVYMPDVSDIILSELSPQIKKKKMKIVKDYGKNVPVVSADPKLIRAIFQNLISNAVKYTPSGGNVTIGVSKKDNDILIKVADTGYGIPEAQKAKVFSKFFRADNIKDKIAEGTGLGLFIVKTIVEQSGGKIWFESKQDEGTVFYITFPLEGMKKKAGVKGLS